MKVLDQPLVVSGELAWLGGDKLAAPRRCIRSARRSPSPMAR